MDQVPGQGELVVKQTDLEAPFGRFSTGSQLPRGTRYVAPEGFLEAAGTLLGSYTLEDRTVFVFDHLTMEVFRGGGLYAFLFPPSSLDEGV